MNKLKVIGFSGSLRSKSFNNYLLNNFKEISSDIIDLEILNITDIPLYNEDLWNNTPISVIEFKDKVKECNSIIISTPEYNYSYSGVTKNLIDWLSRNPNVLDKKVIGIMGASIGFSGTARAQLQLRPVLTALNTYVLSKPEIYLSYSETKFNKDGKLIDNDTINKIKEYAEEFISFSSNFY